MSATMYEPVSRWQPDALSAGSIALPPGSTLGPRWQDTVQLVFLEAGTISLRVDEAEQRTVAGTVSLLVPGHVERFRFSERSETRHAWLNAPPDELDRALLDRLEAAPPSIPLSAAMAASAREAVAVARSSLPSRRPLLLALAGVLLWRYVAEAEAERPPSRPLHPAVTGVVELIGARLPERLTLELLAAHVAVTPAHLVRLFRRDLGETPMAYLWRRRVEHGADLLARTGLPVSTIAARSGFLTSHHFSRRVTAQLGHSPRELRRLLWQPPEPDGATLGSGDGAT